MRGRPVVAPYSPSDSGTGNGFSLHRASLSTSKDRQTATRAPFGQTLGVSLRPALTLATACLITSSVASIPIGDALRSACGRDGSCRLGGVCVQAASPKHASKTVNPAVQDLFLMLHMCTLLNREGTSRSRSEIHSRSSVVLSSPPERRLWPTSWQDQPARK